METAELIEKEEVSQYHLIKAETGNENITKEKLQRALRLGNEFKGKTKITFMTDQGLKRIETTVWSVTDEFIQIKGGVALPLYALVNIE